VSPPIESRTMSILRATSSNFLRLVIDHLISAELVDQLMIFREDRQRERHESINQEQSARPRSPGARKWAPDSSKRNNAPKNCPATPLGGGTIGMK